MSSSLGTDPGLCGGCLHRQILRSSHSAFVRCGLSDRDPAFPRYPRLPVLDCRGFAEERPSSTDAELGHAR